MIRFEFTITNPETGEKVHTFTWAADHIAARIRIKEQTETHPETWSGWTF